MKNKKIPMRTCIGCREMKPKLELMRIVRTPEGEVSLDLTGRKNGRGAYVCKNKECLIRIRKRKALSNAFGMPVDDAVYENIEKEFELFGQ